MNLPNRSTMLSLAIALALLGPALPATAAPVSQEVRDARQETQIWTTYALSPYLRAHDLQVQVHDGKATLTGVVDEEVNRALAREIALGVSGIKSVDDRIQVKADHVAKHRAEPNYGDNIEDASITAAVKSKLLWSKHTDGLDTQVETRFGRVVLKGTADTVGARQAAGRLAYSTRGVVAVDNRLVVARGKSRGTAAPAAVSDGWITTKVKSNYYYSQDVRGTDIKVGTKDGVVTLDGKVGSGAERALAIELAENVRGVKSVHAKRLTH